MKKKISIILNKNYRYIGKKGTIHKVSPGYALNYLIPQNIANFANEKTIKHYKMFENIAEQNNTQMYTEANRIKVFFNKIKQITIAKKAGEKFQIFGSLNEKNIIEAIYYQTGKKLDKKQLIIPEIKHLGIFEIKIIIRPNIECILKINLIPENI
uniref:50S ribosomal protein L9, chloroplastic n=1 Tax=Anotrichium furcellatum TaxID=41999 RepID=A0A4D6WRU6_9FLOR|nr:ribosomal protein L9 [Anotrichium furcellatum]